MSISDPDLKGYSIEELDLALQENSRANHCELSKVYGKWLGDSEELRISHESSPAEILKEARVKGLNYFHFMSGRTAIFWNHLDAYQVSYRLSSTGSGHRIVYQIVSLVSKEAFGYFIATGRAETERFRLDGLDPEKFRLTRSPYASINEDRARDAESSGKKMPIEAWQQNLHQQILNRLI